LSDVCKFVGGKGNQDRSSEYTIPYYESNGIFGFVKNALYTGEYVITARCMSIGAVHYVNGAFYPSDHTINMTSSDANKLNNRFLYFWLLLNNKVLKDLTSGIKPGIRKSDVMEIKMPLPPLEIQKEIVESLDLIYNNATTAKAAAASIKAQMAAVMRSVGARGYEKKKLGDVCEFNNVTKHDTSFGKENGEYPFYTGAMNNKLFTDAPDIKDLVIIMNRTNGAGKCNLYIDSNCAVAGQTIVFYMKDKNTTTLRYLYYYLNTYKTRVEEGYIGSNHKNMSNGFMEMFLVELPPLPIQQEVLTILNEMESELKTMEQMAAKAEQRAKFVLDGYLSSQKVEPEIVHEVAVDPVTPVNEVVEATVVPVAPITPPKAKRTIIRLKKTDPVV